LKRMPREDTSRTWKRDHALSATSWGRETSSCIRDCIITKGGHRKTKVAAQGKRGKSTTRQRTTEWSSPRGLVQVIPTETRKKICVGSGTENPAGRQPKRQEPGERPWERMGKSTCRERNPRNTNKEQLKVGKGDSPSSVFQGTQNRGERETPQTKNKKIKKPQGPPMKNTNTTRKKPDGCPRI